MSEIIGAIIDEFHSLTPKQQDRIVFLATPDPEATELLFSNVFKDESSGITMWYSDEFKEAMMNHPIVLEKVRSKLSDKQQYLDSDVVTLTQEYAATTVTSPSKKQHKQPFWTKDWRKHR